MKKLFLLLLLLAAASASWAQRITRSYQNQSLSSVLEDLNAASARYDISFIYNELEDFSVTCSVERMSLEDALRTVVGFYPVRIVKDGSRIFVECTHKAAYRLTGTVVDGNGQPVAYANVSLLSPADSILLSGGVSNESGVFVVPCDQSRVLLRVSFVGYKTVYRLCSGEHAGVVRMEPDNYVLGGVVVKGERPVVTVRDGVLAYDMETFARQHVVDNLYDAIRRLPDVDERNGNLMLTGSSKLTILLNGKPTTMTGEQLRTFLQNMPVDRAARAEIMRNAPPKYHVRGAAVNIVLARSSEHSMQGEARAAYENQFYGVGEVGGSFRLTTPRLTADALCSIRQGRSLTSLELESSHGGQHISNEKRIVHEGVSYVRRAALDYKLSETGSIELAYNGSSEPGAEARTRTWGNVQNSLIEGDNDEDLNNLSLHCNTGIGLSLSADYTTFHSSWNQHFHDRFRMYSRQHIEKLSAHADQEHSLGRKWTLGYGLSYTNVYSKDLQVYHDVEPGLETADTYTRFTEQSTEFYGQLSKAYKGGFSVSLSGTGEYYSIGGYHRWAFYPQASLTWPISPAHVAMLSLSTDKEYPSYWQMQSSVTYLDSYQEVRNVAGLRPARTSSLSATYLLNRKYSLTLFYEDRRDYFTQLAYQVPDRLALVYLTRNWDFSRQLGLALNVPFSVGTWLKGHFNTVGLWQHQRCDDFYDVPFDRRRLLARFSLNGTVTLSEALALELSSTYTTGPIQGYYDLTDFFGADASLRYTFLRGRARLTAGVSDIFNSDLPRPSVDYGGQHFSFNTARYHREVFVRLAYTFNNYKKKDYDEVDTSRFGH